ncbi:MAG: aspartate aminotransferase family protein [Holophagaceae bacterium]|jgi:acetylornithine/N-succinyldiaminopimelate aminotransferase
MIPSLFPTYAPYPLVMVRGEGDIIFDDAGQPWIDLYGGHCVCSTGHSHPKVVEAIHRQSKQLIFYSTAGDLAIRREASDRLVAFSGMDTIFFCNSGAEANENALKLAFQITGRKAFGSFQGGWHGRTFLAMTVTDDRKITEAFESIFPEHYQFPFGDIQSLRVLDFSNLACVIVEPIQSMSGIRTASSEWFAVLRQKCTEAGCLLIFDEIQTGIGRLGQPFASQYFQVRPDFITSAKGLASGIPIGALMMTETTAQHVKPHMLGSTFGGGPIACAALIATLDIIQNEKLMEHVTRMHTYLTNALKNTLIDEVKGIGLLLGLKSNRASELKEYLLSQRILVGGSSDPHVLRLMPPLNVRESSLEILVEHIRTLGGKS